MIKLKITHIKFTSYMKLYCIMSICFGMVIGLIGFIIGILGGPVSVSIGESIYTGFVGGLLGLIVFPLFIGIFGNIIGLVTFLPFRLFMKIKKGVFLCVEYEDGDIINDDNSMKLDGSEANNGI